MNTIRIRMRLWAMALGCLLMGPSLTFSETQAIPAQDGASDQIVLHEKLTRWKARGIVKPWNPWRLDWENYLYKRFYASLSERMAARRVTPPERGIRNPWKRGGHPYFAASEGWCQARYVKSLRFLKKADLDDLKKKKKIKSKQLRNINEVVDWREFDYLWVDVRPKEDAHFWFAIEDLVVQPPVVGNFDVKANTWATLEIDLKRAARERALELRKMWGMWLISDSRPGGDYKNLRLVRKGAKTEHPVLKDELATKLPELPPAKSPPEPDLKPDLAAIKAPQTLIYTAQHPVIFTARKGRAYGKVVVYDANNILIIYMDPKAYFNKWTNGSIHWQCETHAVQTLDGGKTWVGINGQKEPSHIPNLFHTTGGKSLNVDGMGGVIQWNQLGCGGQLRQRVSKWSFLGKKGWYYSEKDYVMEEESRHCTHGFPDIVRDRSGRLWCALDIEGREFCRHGLHVRYSDTDGMHWHSWQRGRTSELPGQPGQGRYSPCIAPYKNHIALFFGTKWTWFDGKKWAEPESLGDVFRVNQAVATGSEGLVIKTVKKGVLELKDGKWVQVLPNVNGEDLRLCRSGERITAVRRAGNGLQIYKRGTDGAWGKPEVVAFDFGAILQWQVPSFTPANLVAISYITKDDAKSVKLLLVPSTE